MKSISFDNPYLLLLLLPMLAAVLVPYFIAVRKESKSTDTRISLILHTVIVILSVIAIAGTSYTAVITKTEVVVVADLSYSTSEKTEKIDGRIEELRESFIGNTDMAVVTFGKDCELTVGFGERFKTVGESGVNTDATDIASALNFASELFSPNSIKRVVLITDAMSTAGTDDDDVIAAVNSLFAIDAKVDAIFLDSNIGEGVKEVQINSVDHKSSTYLGQTSAADVLISASSPERLIVELYRDGLIYDVKTVSVTPGFNLVSFELDGDKVGEYEYSARIEAENDTVTENNRVDFVQTVVGELRVLLVTSSKADLEKTEELYGEAATVDCYNTSLKKNKISLPYTVEELIKYDEIIISEVNLVELPNYSEFIKSVDTVVSEFGKSLMTFGNNNIQNKEEDIFKNLENMLPVNYGNNKRDGALITFIVDCSKSMNTASRFNTTKELLKGMLDLLSPEDKVCIISFYADNYVEQSPIEVGDKTKLIDVIENNLIPKQGTVIGSAIDRAYEEMKDLDYERKMAILISDGLSFKKVSEDDTALVAAASMYENDIIVSTVNMWSSEPEAIKLMQDVAELGGGTAYYIENERDWQGKVKTEFADQIHESVINETVDVTVDIPKDEVMTGVGSLPAIDGFVRAKIKDNASTVLSAVWEKSEYATLTVPIYAYWDYGNGRVSTFNTHLSGEWVSGWTTEGANTFFENVIKTAVPEQRCSTPYTVNVTERGMITNIELIPAELNIDTVAKLTFVTPSGASNEYVMIFDGTKYVLDVVTDELGRYGLSFSYEPLGKEPYTSEMPLVISYFKEYDSFTVYTDTVLHNALRGRGEVVGEDEIPTYEYDKSRLTTYTVDFTLPFLIAACALFVVDVMIRKLKWKDIVSMLTRGGRR